MGKVVGQANTEGALKSKTYVTRLAEQVQQQNMEIALLKQEVRGLKAMLNQYKRDYKKLLEKEV